MIIDVHFHILAKDDVPGCCMSPRLQAGTASWVANLLLGTIDSHIADMIFPSRSGEKIPPLSSALMRERLLREIDEAREIDGAVILALDGIFREDGEPAESHMVITPEYVKQVVDEYNQGPGRKRLYASTSIHPYRPDALARLARAKEEGAVLCKWICSSQQLDPNHHKSLAFLEEAARLDMPLLYHAGWEGAVPVPDQEWRDYEDPRSIIPALEMGVKVILAHCASPYEKDHPNYVPALMQMFKTADKRGWELYTDISAMLLGPWRGKALSEFLPNVDPARLVYGSDFPIPTQDLTLGQLRVKADITTQVRAWMEKNLLDKDVLSKRGVGIPQSVFENTAKVLGLVLQPA